MEERWEEEEEVELIFTEVLPCTRHHNKTAAHLDSFIRYHYHHSASQVRKVKSRTRKSLSNVPKTSWICTHSSNFLRMGVVPYTKADETWTESNTRSSSTQSHLMHPGCNHRSSTPKVHTIFVAPSLNNRKISVPTYRNLFPNSQHFAVSLCYKKLKPTLYLKERRIHFEKIPWVISKEWHYLILMAFVPKGQN